MLPETAKGQKHESCRIQRTKYTIGRTWCTILQNHVQQQQLPSTSKTSRRVEWYGLDVMNEAHYGTPSTVIFSQ